MPAPLEATMFAIIPEHPEVGDMSPKVWPHISVIPWVQLGDWHHEVLEEVGEIVHDLAPVVLEPRGMTTIGAKGHEKRAQKIFSPELKELHMRLLYCLGSFGIVVSHPEWAGHKYKPHITSEELALKRWTTVNTIYAIDNTKLDPEDERGTKLIVQSFKGGGHEI